ncbi:MAG: ribonuclease HII [Chromatiales bacterium]|nr:ribonuclease HII [Chromatiales bacterium]
MNLAGETVAGIDEAGRGPLAGPVVAAVVVLGSDQSIAGVRDSKQLTVAQRAEAALRIRAEALEWALGEASTDEIDELNILQATLLAMQRAFAGLTCVPARVEVDGNRAPRLAGYRGTIETVVEGDRLRLAIGAASILAKVHRDDLMGRLHAIYPDYGFEQHKGYPTARHRAALRLLGPCPEHRRSFAPVRAAMGNSP